MVAKKDKNNPNRFYVYLHRRGDNNEVFYIGKGCYDRATAKSGRNTWWKRVVAKCGYTVEFVEKGMSEESAYDLEVELIKFYRENGHNLCNITAGGECASTGYKFPEHLVQRHTGRVNSDEWKSMMRDKIGRRVLCSNGMVFHTCKEAEVWLGNSPSSSKVSTCCRREKSSANGLVWRYLDDCEDLQQVLDEGKDAFVEWDCQAVLDRAKPKKVYCSNGMSFDSGYAAVKWYHSQGFIKVHSSYISACCNGRKKKLHGLEWSFEDKFQNPPPSQN